MRCNPLRWLWGVVPVAVLGWFAVQLEHTRIERDLEGRVASQLSNAGQGWARVIASGRDLAVSGSAESEADPPKAVQIASNVWGVRVVQNQATLLEKVDRFLWSAERSGNNVILSGNVPSEVVRIDILNRSRASFRGAEIVDNMRVVRGAPNVATWTSGASFALDQLAALKAGKASLDGLGLTLEGEAGSSRVFGAVQSALRTSLPRGVTLAAERILPPEAKPYNWTARLSDRVVTLSGHVPDVRTREQIVAAARAAVPGARILDQMELARGAGGSYAQSVVSGIAALGRLERGLVSLSEDRIGIEGRAASQAIAGEIVGGLNRGVPRNVSVFDSIDYPPPPPPPPPVVIAPPAVAPFTTNFQVSDRSVILRGYAPGAEALRAALDIARARFPGRAIDNRLEVASGAPAGWLSCVAGGLRGVSRLGAGELAISDQSMVLRGSTDDPQVPARISAEVGSLIGNACRATYEIGVRPPPGPPPVSPFTSDVDVRDRVVILTGYAPSEEAKDRASEAARERFPSRPIENRMTVAAGAPAGWLQCLTAGLEGMSRLGVGRIAMSDQRLSLRSATDEEDQARLVPEQMRRDAGRACETGAEITVRPETVLPLVWRATATERDVILQGEVPSRAVADSLFERARARFPDRNVVNRMSVVDTRTRLWPIVASNGIDALAELRTGEVAIMRGLVQATGEAISEERRSTARARLATNMPNIYNVREEIRVVEPPPPPPVVVVPPPPVPPEVKLCEERLRSAAREGVIRFARASADITRESRPTLDTLARIARNCENVVMEVEGHTEAEGELDGNQRLSERRANAVAEYLIRAGVDRRMIVAVGYGQTRPLVPNDTADGRAINRRIEFTVTRSN